MPTYDPPAYNLRGVYQHGSGNVCVAFWGGHWCREIPEEYLNWPTSRFMGETDDRLAAADATDNPSPLNCERKPSIMVLRRFLLKAVFGVVLALVFFVPPRGAEAADFEKWEKEITAYEQADRTNPPVKGGVLFIGSSTIRLWKTLAQDFPQHRVINRGFGGSQIVDSTHFAERIIFPYVPRMILLRAGGNDIHAGKSPELVFSDFRAFVAKVQDKLPEVQIAYIALSPSIARWDEKEKGEALNRMIREYAREIAGLKYIAADSISLGPDGKPRPELFVADKLHFSPEGYKLLVECVKPHLPK